MLKEAKELIKGTFLTKFWVAGGAGLTLCLQVLNKIFCICGEKCGA